MSCVIKVQLDERAEIPSNHHDTDTGYDLKFIIQGYQETYFFLQTGLSVEPLTGYYFDIAPRSSISKTLAFYG